MTIHDGMDSAVSNFKENGILERHLDTHFQTSKKRKERWTLSRQQVTARSLPLCLSSTHFPLPSQPPQDMSLSPMAESQSFVSLHQASFSIRLIGKVPGLQTTRQVLCSSIGSCHWYMQQTSCPVRTLCFWGTWHPALLLGVSAVVIARCGHCPLWAWFCPP